MLKPPNDKLTQFLVLLVIFTRSREGASGGREEGREEGRKGGREGREGGRKGGREEGGREEGGRERNRGRTTPPKKQNHFLCKLKILLLPRETSN